MPQITGLRLKSLAEIWRSNPKFQSEFSMSGNVESLGNDGFVFFRLCEDKDKAIDTRYGKTEIRLKPKLLDTTLSNAKGWVSLYDQLIPLSSTTMQSIYFDMKSGSLVAPKNKKPGFILIRKLKAIPLSTCKSKKPSPLEKVILQYLFKYLIKTTPIKFQKLTGFKTGTSLLNNIGDNFDQLNETLSQLNSESIKEFYQQVFPNTGQNIQTPNIYLLFRPKVDVKDAPRTSNLYKTAKWLVTAFAAIIGSLGSWYFYRTGESTGSEINKQINIEDPHFQFAIEQFFAIATLILRGILQTEGCIRVFNGLYDTLIQAPRQLMYMLRCINGENNQTYCSFSQFKEALETLLVGWIALSVGGIAGRLSADFTDTRHWLGITGTIFAMITTYFMRATFMKHFLHIEPAKLTEQSVLLASITEMNDALRHLPKDAIEKLYQQVHPGKEPKELWCNEEKYEAEFMSPAAYQAL